MTCCLCAKYLLLFFNLIIWLTGAIFVGFGILLLYKRDLHELFAILSYDSEFLPSILNIGYVLIGVGTLVFIVGLLGCCGSVHESRLLLGLYVFFIILVMGGELAIAMYTLLLGSEWETTLPYKLKARILTFNYSKPQRFELDLDMVHKQFECCGIDGPLDFSANHDYKIYGNRLPPSCCSSLTDDPCTETTSYRLGCYRYMNDYVQPWPKLVVPIGIGIALLELFALIMAVCVCRNTLDDYAF